MNGKWTGQQPMKVMIEPPSSEQSRRFYDGLSAGREKRGLWGLEARFNPSAIANHPTAGPWFVDIVRPYIAPADRVLDLGCGAGGFLQLMAPLAREAIGADLSPGFVEAARAMVAERGFGNVRVELVEAGRLPFADGSIDVAVLVDVIHHLEDVPSTLAELRRVLRPGGKLLVFEPNKRNPLLWLLCLLDRNEWGLLRLGTRAAYRRLLQPVFHVEAAEPNGLLIGPKSSVAVAIANLVSGRRWRGLLGFLSPKIFIAARA